MEACIFDAICTNWKTLWQLRVGEDFECKMDYEGFLRLRDWVLQTKSAQTTATEDEGGSRSREDLVKEFSEREPTNPVA